VQRVVFSRGKIIPFLERTFFHFLRVGIRGFSDIFRQALFADVEMACCVNHFTCDEAILKDFLAKLLE
jgi:hypothetical protein